MSSLPAPLPHIGPVKARWAAHQARSRAIVSHHARQHCQACGREDRHPDWAHLAGRRHVVAEPWASSPQLTVGLCRECHTKIDTNVDMELRDNLRRSGVGRLCDYGSSRGVAMGDIAELSLTDPLAAIIQGVGRLVEAGIEPNCCSSHEVMPSRGVRS